ncbi:MAG: hypothetical protein F4X94_02105 [Dehalococcoidia bacterium]|nr:hypothetical protein [Dehalococcoidia bacterium]
MDKIVLDKRDKIARLCKKYGVKRLDVVGDVTVGLSGRGSRDLDFLASFHDPDAPNRGGWNAPQFKLAVDLEDLFEGELDRVVVGIEGEYKHPSVKPWIEKIREVVYADS